MQTICMTNLTGFDLNLLKALDALLRESSTTDAGRRIGLSQPAVSAALGRLRAQLGDPLFVRKGQGLTPTPFAETLRGPVQDALAQIETILGGPAGFVPSESDRVFHLSGSDYFSELLFPPLLKQLQDEAPKIGLRLVDQVFASNMEAMQKLEIDLAFWPRLHFPDTIAAEEICISRFLICAPKDHPKLKEAGIGPGDPIPLEVYLSFAHATFAPDGQPRADGDLALANRGFERHTMVSFPTFSGVYAAVAYGGLLGGLPRQLAMRYEKAGLISLHPMPLPLDDNRLCMIWNRSLTHDAGHAWLRDKVAGIMAEYSDPPSGKDNRGSHF